MKKYAPNVIMTVVGVFLFGINLVSATIPFLYIPSCQVVGEIQSVDYSAVNRYDKETDEVNQDFYYSLSIETDSVKPANDTSTQSECQNELPIGEQGGLRIPSENKKEGDIFRKGDMISGLFVGKENKRVITSYMLTKNTADKTNSDKKQLEPYQASKLAFDAMPIYSVTNVRLDEDQNDYIVDGKIDKKIELPFLKGGLVVTIPMRAVIDASSGVLNSRYLLSYLKPWNMDFRWILPDTNFEFFINTGNIIRGY